VPLRSGGKDIKMSENWVKVSVYTTPEGIEPLFGAILSLGIEGVEICDEGDFLDFLENNRSKWDYVDDEMLESKKEPTHLNVFLRDNMEGREQLSMLRECFENLKKIDLGIDIGSLEMKFEDIPENLWFERWKKYYTPTEIGKTILVVPQWEENPETDRKILKINPGMLFGTGTHNTTRLCMQYLEELVKEGDSVLDIGCGSGILSILSLILGAGNASAVDIDPNATHIAYENAELNNIFKDRYFVTSGNILEDNPFEGTAANKEYDIVVANIVADVIIPLSKIVSPFLKKDALFLCSGIIENRIGDVLEALEENGFEVIEKRQDGEWFAVLSKME